ncbi:MAG TPA: energy transducer TonB [Longimicrobium sp.]|nr:energy transducer TonB [Longimicrobium sp.]
MSHLVFRTGRIGGFPRSPRLLTRMSGVLLLLIAAPARAQQGQADSARVHALHEVDVPPRAQNAAAFTAALQQAYPPALRDAGVGGTVQVSFVVGTDGRVADVRLVEASDSAFSAPTVQAVSVLHFSPAQVGGRPVPVRVDQPITWRAQAAPEEAAARAPRLPEGVVVYALDSVSVRPMPRNFREFEAAVRQLYPAELRGSGASAQVLAGFAVDPDGRPVYAQVLESTDARFDAATLQAVNLLRFQPARLGREAVPVWMEVPVEWEEAAPPGAGADTLGAYEVEMVSSPPRARNTRTLGHTLARLYPPEMRDAGRGGQVSVRFIVQPDGRTSHARIVRSTNSAFDMPALDVVRTLRFDPALLNGHPVRVWVELPLQWRVGTTPGYVAPGP